MPLSGPESLIRDSVFFKGAFQEIEKSTNHTKSNMLKNFVDNYV